MKKRFLILNSIMGLVVLFAILFQSFDAMSHLEKQFSEKHCNHKYNHSQTEINHAHEGFDHCFTCEFAFSSFISPSKITFTVPKIQVVTKYSAYYSKEITQSFRGSLFALRAPPIFIA
ncbi:hypothetical protein [Flavobacterium wongokense]|uniref:hypothetical protein n=1 Tax=Flavobacterium wongokense TaxID=2910674 RepID=UPI001F237878|nr:hypothetical protein [Flavobacterium sp. WG47]MCF6131268.1 hypothetical protein [Flavobacterium sp. WG47]